MNILATCEALESFSADAAGAGQTRLKQLADATRAMLLQSSASGASGTAWADHNLGVIVSEAFAIDATAKAGAALFHGVRRRLAEALTADSRDLAVARALALGSAGALDSARTADDMILVARAAGAAGAGPKLTSACVALVIRGAASKHKDAAAAARKLAPAVRESLERVGARMANHPGPALDRLRLYLLDAEAASGADRDAALARLRGELADYERRFGASGASRGLVTSVLGLMARSSNAPGDLRRDTTRLITSEIAARRLSAKRASKLIRALVRAKALDGATARTIDTQLRTLGGVDGPHWFDARATLLDAMGDHGGLLALSERTLMSDRDHRPAAYGVLDRVLNNLDSGLASPVDSDVLDAALLAVAPAALAHFGPNKVTRLLALAEETFGAARALAFIRGPVMGAKALKSRESIWIEALRLAEGSGDKEALIAIARQAIKTKGVARARLALAKAHIDSGQHLDEAAAVLKPLTDKKGPLAAQAHALMAGLGANPKLRESRYQSMLAYEAELGIGTAKKFELKVVYTGHTYVLAEITERNAPDGYGHRHLRAMLRDDDLPTGIAAFDLEKGDIISAPLRGQDGDTKRDKSALRVYWAADATQVSVALDPADLEARWAALEARFGIGADAPANLKLSWDSRKKAIVARLIGPGGKEFKLRPAISADQLPEGIEPHQLGRSKRMTGLVTRDQSRQNQRAYVVIGQVALAEAKQEKVAPASATEQTQTSAPEGGEEPSSPSPKGATSDAEQAPATTNATTATTATMIATATMTATATATAAATTTTATPAETPEPAGSSTAERPVAAPQTTEAS